MIHLFMYDIVCVVQVDSEIVFDHPSNVTGDRQTLYCVPIPGESPWVKHVSLLPLTLYLLDMMYVESLDILCVRCTIEKVR